MKRQRRMLDSGTLAEEPLPGVPLVEILEDRRVLIEHHRGVVAYGTEEICVRLRFGQLRLCGAGLRLAKMTSEQLVICGRIASVHIVRSRA